MSFDKLSSGRDAPNDINVVIEIPMNGEPIKYEVDKESGAIFVDRFMSTAMHYPCNYGYIPRTLSGDGDPADVLVLSPVPLMPHNYQAAAHLPFLGIRWRRQNAVSGNKARPLSVVRPGRKDSV